MGAATNLRETVWFRDLRLLRINSGVAICVFTFFSCINLFYSWMGNVDIYSALFLIPMVPGYATLALIRPLHFLKKYHVALFLLVCTGFVVSSVISDFEIYWIAISTTIVLLQIASVIVFFLPENYFGPETENH